MFEYLLKRLLLFIPTLFGIILATFTIIQFVPGGPIETFISNKINGGNRGSEAGSAVGNRLSDNIQRKGVDEEQINQLRHLYGFDQPVHIRFFKWCYQLVTFQFGESYFHHREVKELIFEKLPVSASLGIISFLLTYLFCIPLGIMKAVKAGSIFDTASSVLILVGYSIPGFVLGVFLIVLFGGGSFWNWFPIHGLTSDDFETFSPWGKLKDYIHHLVLPTICMSIGSFAVMTNLTKNTVLENIKQLYVLTARCKGLSEKWVIGKHVFRNSMIPLVTGFAGSFLTILFGSSLLIETLFSLDGLGLLSYESVLKRDYPVVMANLFIFSLLFVIGNLLSDLMYVVVDPRISFKSIEE